MEHQNNETLSGGDALVRSLIIEGIDTVFGLPGIQLDPMFNALHDSGNAISVINSRHEQGVAYMAFGYSQSTGKVGAYAVVPGPGILNTTAALSTAYACNTRVLAITGQIPSTSINKGFGMLHEIPEQLEVMKGLTKHSARINHPTEAPQKISEAFRQLRSGRPRPVGLEMPMDIMWKKSEVTLGSRTSGCPAPLPDPDLVEKAAKILGESQQPMIFVGGGAYEACQEIKTLAETLQAPVISYQNGRGILDERHYLAHTNTAGAILWKNCDAAISIGCRMQAELMSWGMDDALKIIHVDIDPTEINRIMKPDVGLVSDAAFTTRKIVDALNLIKPPFNVNEVAQLAAVESLKDTKFVSQSVKHNLLYASKIKKFLNQYNIYSNEISANFLLLDFSNCKFKAKNFYEKLKAKGIILRSTEYGYKIKNRLRLTIGSRNDNLKFMRSVERIFGK